MKTKFLILSLLTFFIFSCNSDDENAGPPPIPEDEKLIDNIVSSGDDGLNYQFEYNEDKTVRSMNISNFILYNYTYENNRISKISMIGNGQVLDYHLEYDQNGMISSFSLDDVVTPVTYNAAEKFYLYQKENGDEFMLYLNENDDIYRAIEYDAEYDETNSIVYIYENSGKGVLTNTNNITIATVLVSGNFEIGIYFFPISNNPIKTLSFVGGNIFFENELDDQGFISEMAINTAGEGEPSVMTFNYTQL